jgi:hypothetical protein
MQSKELYMKTTGKQSLPRRHFLQQLLLAGGATGAGAAMLVSARPALSVSSPQATAGNSPEQAKGYRLTEHIRTYYDKARI